MTVNKNDLFKHRAKVQEVEIPDLGIVKVRALTRSEVLKLGIGAGQEMDIIDAERKLISAAMIDPELTEEEVGQWQDASPAQEIEKVFMVIVGLSGLTNDLPKETVKQFRR